MPLLSGLQYPQPFAHPTVHPNSDPALGLSDHPTTHPNPRPTHPKRGTPHQRLRSPSYTPQSGRLPRALSTPIAIPQMLL
jgi:hypothetical protein